jgi:hypothetical protein
MRIKRTKHGFSFSGECETDYKILGEMVLGDKRPPDIKESEQQPTTQSVRQPEEPASARA